MTAANAFGSCVQLDPQLFVGQRPDQTRWVDATSHHAWKPGGGLWTSTHREGCSSWTEWLESETKWASWPRWLLVPEPAKVFTLDSWDALQRLFDAYGVDEWNRWRSGPAADRYGWGIDPVRFAADFDALHLTEHGLWGAGPDGLPLRLASRFVYGWDCESTWWTRWCFGSSVEEVSRGSQVV